MRKNELLNELGRIEIELDKQHAMFDELFEGHFDQEKYNINSTNEDEQIKLLSFIKNYPHYLNLFNIAYDYHIIVADLIEKLSETIKKNDISG